MSKLVFERCQIATVFLEYFAVVSHQDLPFEANLF